MAEELEDGHMHPATIPNSVRETETLCVGYQGVGGPMADKHVGVYGRDHLR